MLKVLHGVVIGAGIVAIVLILTSPDLPSKTIAVLWVTVAIMTHATSLAKQ